MAESKLTLIGFNNYMKEADTDLFLNLDLPEGIDTQTVIDNILLKGGEFEVLYSNPYFLRDSITMWSKKWYWTFEKWITAINIDYAPLENYDRKEDWSETENVETENHITDSTSGTNSGTTENQVSAFDTAAYSNKDKVTTNANTSSSGQNDSDGSVDSKRGHTGRIHGNIGVTTSQQMLQSELDLARWNLYNEIADIFLMEYVLPIY